MRGSAAHDGASRVRYRSPEPTPALRHARAEYESQDSGEWGGREAREGRHRNGERRARKSRTTAGKERRQRPPTNVMQNIFFATISLLIAYEIFHSMTAVVIPRSRQLTAGFSPLSQEWPAGQASPGAAPRSAEEIARQNRELAKAYDERIKKRRSPGSRWSQASLGADSGATSPAGSGHGQHIVWSYFEQASAAMSQSSSALSQSLSDTADAASSAANSAWTEAARYAHEMGIKAGLVQLPTLVVTQNANGTYPEGAAVEEVRDTAPGASWSSSAWGGLNSLPAYLKAVAMHSAPKWTSEEAMAQLEERGSIFTARRKGEWMGCTRPYHLACKGVYRAIKRVDATTVLDTACMLNAHWLPLVIQHLRKEFRFIQLVCAVQDKSRVEYVRAAFEDVDHVTFTTMNPFRDNVVNKTDLVVAVKLLDKKSLIHAMRFFRNMQRNAATVSHIVYENFPSSNNRRDVNDGKQLVRVNTFLPPFMFGRTVHRYENIDESPTSDVMEIVTIATDALFANKQTPAMADLGDPKLKKRRKNPTR